MPKKIPKKWNKKEIYEFLRSNDFKYVKFEGYWFSVKDMKENLNGFYLMQNQDI